MVDKELMAWLENNGAIDQRFVLWWQKGFEGRRVYSEEEFAKNALEVSYEITYDDFYNPLEKPQVITHHVWPSDDVPILIKNYTFLGRQVPFFITTKPLSHDDNEGWDSLQKYQGPLQNFMKGFEFLGEVTGDTPMQVNHRPHIRGVVVEDTKDFLFWLPLSSGPNMSRSPFSDLDISCMYDSVDFKTFYNNLYDWERGRKLNEISIDNREIVPYYLFNPNRDHITVYPAPVLNGELDVPILIKGNPSNVRPQILGIGKFGGKIRDSIFYCGLDEKIMKRVEKSLIERLGKI